MKRWFPSARLKWKEPRLVLRAKEILEEQALTWWAKPALVFGVAGLFMLQWALARLNPARHPLALARALPLAFGGGLFFAYAVPWLYRLCPSEIRVYGHGITRSQGNGAVLWRYPDLERCELAEIQVGAARLTVLWLRTRKGRRILLGVPEECAAELARVLAEMPVAFAVTSRPGAVPEAGAKKPWKGIPTV